MYPVPLMNKTNATTTTQQQQALLPNAFFRFSLSKRNSFWPATFFISHYLQLTSFLARIILIFGTNNFFHPRQLSLKEGRSGYSRDAWMRDAWILIGNYSWPERFAWPVKNLNYYPIFVVRDFTTLFYVRVTLTQLQVCDLQHGIWTKLFAIFLSSNILCSVWTGC